MKTKSVIIYPQFLECQDHTLDKFWKDMFHNCACNKFPPNVRYDGTANNLSIRIPIAGGKYQTELYSLSDNSANNYKLIVELFREKLDIKSAIDLKFQKNKLEELLKDKEINLDCEWKKLKPKYLQEFMLTEYIVRLSKQYDLNPREIKKLNLLIETGMNLKKIVPDDIIYENRKVTEITSLSYDETTRKFVITGTYGNYTRSDKSNATNKLDSSVENFIRDYNMKKSKIKI